MKEKEEEGKERPRVTVKFVRRSWRRPAGRWSFILKALEARRSHKLIKMMILKIFKNEGFLNIIFCI